MEISQEQLLQLIGQKEIELYALRVQVAQLQQQLQDTKDKSITDRDE